MLEKILIDPGAVQRFRRGLLGPHLDSFVAVLDELGYSRASKREQLWLLQDLGRSLQQWGITAGQLDEKALKKFLARRRRRGRLRRSDAATVRRFLAHLREQGIARPARVVPDDSPIAQLQRRYETYLRKERGLSPSTLHSYLPLSHRFLTEQFGNGPLHLETLGPPDVSNFVLRHALSMCPKLAQLMVSALRSFLRFLFRDGEIVADLAACVPTVANWRLAAVPKYISPEDVERLLNSCDRSTTAGRRNYAILLLLARLALRAGEVVAMRLEDIHWRAGELLVRGKGSRHDRLPLTKDVGSALATYLRHDRPRCGSRQVFVRDRAPYRGLGNPSTVSTIVRRALARAGLEPPSRGAHLLRHSLATGMLRRGATMAEISEVLRHRSVQTTEIYAKVDVAGLSALAQPWPGEGGAQ
jgi:site-specific recombinase XerD